MFLPDTVCPLPIKQSRSSDPAAIDAFGHIRQPTRFALQHNGTLCLKDDSLKLPTSTQWTMNIQRRVAGE